MGAVLPSFGGPRPLVFTNGVFDVLHVGHARYLAAASALGAFLFVGVNSDKSVRMLNKGTDRPINGQRDRAELVSRLKPVDAVMIFDERTPCALIEALRPDIFVKGGDYNMDELPEAALVRSWGGRAISLPFESGYSTTGIVERIRG